MIALNKQKDENYKILHLTGFHMLPNELGNGNFVIAIKQDGALIHALIMMDSHNRLVVCGHDHVNSTCIRIDGIKLFYGLKTGRGNYFDERLNGGTVIEIDGEGNTHVRHEFVSLPKIG